MQYPLEERIGRPDLLVGRVEEFAMFQEWLDGIPDKTSQSRVILARRKSGKTSFVQRIFNQLWSENGKIIPFFLEIEEEAIWLPNFALLYYQTFASQFIAFRERNVQWVQSPLLLEEILEYGKTHQLDEIVRDATFLLAHSDGTQADLIWRRACSAPHRYASVYDLRFLVILDEFQNIEYSIYPDAQHASQPIKGMAGSYHFLAESKVAPMLVTGSYIGILMKIMSEYLEAGRLQIVRFEPYLTPKEGLLAVYKYAEVYRKPVTNKTAEQINELCRSDPYFISQVIQSQIKNKDLTTTEGVARAVDYEITDRRSMMWKTWAEYIIMTMKRINGGKHTKQLMLFLNKHADRDWTPRQIKKELGIELSEDELYERLVLLSESDMIEQSVSDLRFRGLKDGTLNLILRSRFEEEIAGFQPNLKEEFMTQLKRENNRLRGERNHYAGMVTEYQLATEFRFRKQFRLSDYFTGGRDDTPFNITEVRMRIPFQRPNGKSEEIDIIAKSEDGRLLMVEVRNRNEQTKIETVQELQANALYYGQQVGATVIPAFLSLGGFSKEAKLFCEANGIGMAEEINYYEPEE